MKSILNMELGTLRIETSKVMLDEEHIKKELENGKLFKLDIDIPLKEKYLGMCYNQNNFNPALIEFIKIIEEDLELNEI